MLDIQNKLGVIVYQLLTIRCDKENNKNISCDISKVFAVMCDILTGMHC